MRYDFDDRIRAVNQEVEAVVGPIANSKMTYTVKEIQALLGISKPSAYDLLSSRQFPVLRVGKQFRVPIKRFQDWMEGRCHE